MKLSIGQAWDEVRAALRQSGGLFLIVSLALGVLPTLLVNMAYPTAVPNQVGVVQFLLLTMAMLLGVIGWETIQRLALFSESVGQAMSAAGVPALKIIGAILLLMVPLVLAMSPFALGLQTGQGAAQVAATRAISIVLIIALFPLARFLLIPAVAVAERGGPFHILKRSWQLTRKNSWKLFGLCLMFLLALGLVTFVAQSALGTVILLMFGELQPWSVAALLLGLVVQLAQLIVTLPFTILIARLYAQAVGGSAQASVPSAGGD